MWEALLFLSVGMERNECGEGEEMKARRKDERL